MVTASHRPTNDPGIVSVNTGVLVAVPPPGVVTLIVPIVAPIGTIVVIVVEFTTVKVAAIPLNDTAVAPVKFMPVSVTLCPMGPLVGVNEVIDSVLLTVNIKDMAVESPPPSFTVSVMVVTPLYAATGVTVTENLP